MSAFLYIEGVRGDATEADHRGEIELTSAALSGSAGSGSVRGRGGGQLNQREIAATKKQDSASTALWKATTSGQIFGFMILDFVSDDGTGRYTMGMVVITSMSLSNGIEAFSLNFETLSFEYLPR